MLACLHYTGLDFQSLMRIGAFQRLRRGISIHLALDSSYDYMYNYVKKHV